VILIFVGLSLIAIAIYGSRLRNSLACAPQLHAIEPNLDAFDPQFPTVSVIIPAYNEAENIHDCIMAVLSSTQLSAIKLDVWLVDDQSTDDTLLLAQSLQELLQDSRLHILPGQPRPAEEIWIGKNWACSQGFEQAKGDFLLFIDADVRLKSLAIETAIQKAQIEQSDLLSLAPAITCGCLAEWLVQPLMVNNLAVGQDFQAVNDPQTDVAFAAGPFMLFRRTAYEKLGGHRAVKDQVVEDVELARRTKAAGLRLSYLLGGEFVSVRMYRSLSALWEGWTKNLYMGARRNIKPMFELAAAMLIIYPLPWLCLMAVGYKYLLGVGNWLDLIAAGLAIFAISFHYYLRLLSSQVSQLSLDYWWLGNVGGTIIAAMALVSVFKTETGWGWTWRGRKLKLPI
jgi:cellulose synthase/poly-beta-1,6-N-acetylglucosamine synthase-like glycosyltransferase